MFFDSELPRKQVSLRGNSQKREDKNDFLLRAQQERELRQIAKKKQVSATKIQAFYRSFKHLQKQKELFRFEVDSQFSSISTNSNTLQLKILLRKLLFFYKYFFFFFELKIIFTIFFLFCNQKKKRA